MLDRLKQWRKWTRRERSGDGAPPVVEDSLDVFGSEGGGKRWARAAQSKGPITGRRVFIAAAVVIVLGSGGYYLNSWRPLHVEAATASLTIESAPAGADVLSDGVWKGKTPLTVSVTPGEHGFELLHEGRRKAVRAVARAGAAVVHHVDFGGVAEAAPKKASLRITTDPEKLRVVIDGVPKGTSPLTVEGIDAGPHTVQVTGTSGTIERRVEVAAGESAAVMISAATRSSGPSAGWLTISSPVPLQIAEGKDIIGTSAASKIMLPTGRHELRLSNAEIGFSETRVVQVSSGETASVKVQLPNAPLSINAVPWAEVWVDGVRLGETPIGNHSVRLGPHEVLFRHPEFGERRQRVVVTTNAPARVSVDMRKSGS